MTSEEAVRTFLEFFQSRDHLLIPGASLVPQDDPTLLFINSGMAPLKPYFLGKEQPPHPNLCNIQPCIRTNDIDVVGDRHHLTMFEMLGSWSINKYWKERAIELAFDLLVNYFKFDPNKLYASVYAGSAELNIPPDEESLAAWQRVGLPADHIVLLGEDNFWGPAGAYGPCGPCTEVFFDTGDEHGPAYTPGKHFDSDSRYIEIWNAGVFMEFDKQPSGLQKLALRSVDTGSGLERMLMNLNHVDSVYETDRLAPLMQVVRQQLGGGTDAATNHESKVISDHVRAISFILADGVRPSNVGRGYVPRRLIRRVISMAMRRSVPRFDLASALDVLVAKMGREHPRLEANRREIVQVFEQEQVDFSARVRHGLDRLATVCSKTPISVSGEEALSLFTTFGLPIDIIRDYVRERGGRVDEEAFEREFKRHQEVSRAGVQEGSAHESLEQVAPPTVYVGEEDLASEGAVAAILVGGEFRDRAVTGEEAEIVTDRTSFYAEGGGQIGDRGVISSPSGRVEVADTLKAGKRFWVHRGVVEGEIARGQKVKLTVDENFRRNIRLNHSATHLLQSALRKVLGKHVQQAGSRVEPDKLRFDFQHPQKVTPAELREIERLVNEYIRRNTPSSIQITSYPQALKNGALAFFGENYGAEVRMVQFGDFSIELCGGSHVGRTGDIGLFRIVSESSVSSGVRRIVAVTGEEALKHMNADRDLIESLSTIFQTPPASLERQARAIVAKSKKAQADEGARPAATSQVEHLGDNTPYVFSEVELEPAALREEALELANKTNGIVCLMARHKETNQVSLAITVAKSLTGRFQADAILKKILPQIQGRGGGKAHLAQGGGTGAVDLKPLFLAALT